MANMQMHQNFADLKAQCLQRCQTLQSEINVNVLEVGLAEHADGFDSQATVRTSVEGMLSLRSGALYIKDFVDFLPSNIDFLKSDVYVHYLVDTLAVDQSNSSIDCSKC